MALMPHLVTDQWLPIDSLLADLKVALRAGHTLLQAPTGSGKSTRVPLALMDEDWLRGQRILMLEPRRPAARMTAARMASLLGELLGERVGYQVRFERQVSARTRIEVVTEGILTRRLQSDPGIEGVGLVIFDEFHERNLQSDLGLALTLDIARQLRPELRLLIMSATLDAEAVTRALPEARCLRGDGRSFPVEVRYATRAPQADIVESALAGIRRALQEEEGDVLVFLPGVGEINRCVALLGTQVAAEIDVLPLHGSLPSTQQDQALLPGDPARRRVIVATDIAETSVTIQGIRVVVDSGLTRKPRFDPGSGLSRLVTEAIPRASAEQRAGRAGRLAPGVCYRLWTPGQEHGRPEHRTPEILQSDLASLVLELALWGVKSPDALTWLDPPPSGAWFQAVDLLQALGALDPGGSITPRGRAMAELPVHPRLAAMLLGATATERETAADLAALIGERDPFIAGPDRARSANLEARLDGLRAHRERRATPSMDSARLATAARAAQQLRRMTAGRGAGDAAVARSPGALLALAYPDRVAQRRAGSDNRYRLASGLGAALPLEDALAVHDYLVIAAMDAAGRDGRIQLALPILAEELRQVLAERIQHSRETRWDSAREAVACREVERLGAIELTSRPAALIPEDAVTEILLQQVRERPERALSWSSTARQLQARINLMREQDPSGGWPDLSDEALHERLETWLQPWISGKTRLVEVQALDLAAVLGALLSWEQQQALERETPRTLITPAGNARPIDYASGAAPVLAVPLQELFGLSETPRICRGRVSLLLHLLSPARRPIQVTQDLAGFWARSYAEVRKELRGRYPKHHWPEDPTQAQAVVGGIKRRPKAD